MRKSDCYKLFRLVRILTGVDLLALLEQKIYRMVERAILYGCGYAQWITSKARIQIRRYMLKRCSSCSSDM